MTVAEFTAWSEYRKKCGPLDVQTRVEYTAAMLANVLAAQKGAKTTVRDFLLWAEEKVASVDDVAKFMGAE